MDPMEILGDAIAKEALGFDYGALISAAAEVSKEGVAAGQKKQADDKAAKDSAAAAQKSIAADANWANAEQQLDLAQQSKDAGKIAAAQTLQSNAMSAAVSAATGLSPDAAGKRVAAATAASTKAAQDSLANPKDAGKAAFMRAWQKVASAATSGAAASGVSSTDIAKIKEQNSHGDGNFLTKMHAGIPTWGWMVGGAGVALGVFLLVRSLSGKRR